MNKKAIVLAVLILLLVGVFAKQFLFSGPPANYQVPQTAQAATTNGGETAGAPAQGAAAPATAPSAAVDINDLAKNVQVVDFSYDQTALARNPMTPLVGPQAVIAAAAATTGSDGTGAEADLLSQQLAVTGIIWDEKFPVAVINNDVVAQGDTLAEGIVVRTIETDKVVLAVRDKSVTLPLKRLEEQ